MISKTIFVMYVTLMGSLTPLDVSETYDECEWGINLYASSMSVNADTIKCVEYKLQED